MLLLFFGGATTNIPNVPVVRTWTLRERDTSLSLPDRDTSLELRERDTTLTVEDR